MHSSRRIAALALAATTAFGVIALSTTATATAAAQPAAKAAPVTTINSCARPSSAAARVGMMYCSAKLVTSARSAATIAAGVKPNASTPSGFFPAALRTAYNLPSTTAGSGQTVAIVDAYDDPNAEADLGVYRSQFGIPACTTANGCFKKVGQTGGAVPKKNASWAEEISLDLDMVSAICPNCHILLVEATSATTANLGKAVNEAATLHATEISNSYGGSDETDASAPYYNHPGIAITASSGDDAYGVEFPASSHYVTAVGGTHLVLNGSTRTETAWSDAGSGCSTKNTALTGAASFGTGCSKRAVADVSAVADPATGVAVYDSLSYQGYVGWLVFGGTSVSSPIIASVYALAGNAASTTNNYPYAHSGSLNDVTSGSNGSCSPSQLCTARVGWDGPTGLGTPNGVGAF